MVKNLSAMQETWVRSLGWEDPLEEGVATHFSVLDWRIPLDRGAWRAPWGHKESDTTEWPSTAQHKRLHFNSSRYSVTEWLAFSRGDGSGCYY